MNDLKKRIHSIGEIRKITRAMGLISAVKMRDARDREAIAHPFITQTALTIAELVKRSPELVNSVLNFSKFEKDDLYPVQIYLLTGDKGLSGSFNESILTLAERLIEMKRERLVEQGYTNIQFELKFMGQVGRERMRQMGYRVNSDFSFSIEDPTYYRSMDLADEILDAARSGKAAEIFFVYCRLDTAISIEPSYTRILPIDAEGMLWVTQTRHERLASTRQEFNENFSEKTGIRASANQKEDDTETEEKATQDTLQIPFAFEGDEEKVVSYLIGTYLNALTYGLLTESFASEQLSRMTSMEGATRNADDLLLKLTRERNRYRQMQITTEITEIVSGAEAIV